MLQAYATADLGVIAYETIPDDGLIVNENMIVEIVRPGTGTPVADGEDAARRWSEQVALANTVSDEDDAADDAAEQGRVALDAELTCLHAVWAANA